VSAWIRPDSGKRCFDAIPGTLEWALTGASLRPRLPAEVLGALDGRYERVLLVWIDAFGWRFAEQLAQHPLLVRARRDGVVERITSQFPSTTTAHVVTLMTGLPVAEHGLYEWYCLEPSLDRLICPLRYSFAGDEPEGLRATALQPEELIPFETLPERLAREGRRTTVSFAPQILDASLNRVLQRGAALAPGASPLDRLEAGAAALAEPGLAVVYIDEGDSALHAVGPDVEEPLQIFDAALGLVEQTLALLPAGTLVLVTADHGVQGISPQRTVYVNELWPGLEALLRRGADGRPLAPAGSSRDLFLHVLPGKEVEVAGRLGELLAGVADVRRTDELLRDGYFGPAPGAPLLDRIGQVVCLPRDGEAVWWHEPGRFEQRFHAQHGGLSAAEMEIPLIALAL
jgi:hypothetical protein